MSIPASLFFAVIWLLNAASFEYDGRHGMAALAFIFFMLFGLNTLREAIKRAELRSHLLWWLES